MKSLRSLGLAVAAIALFAPHSAHADGYQEGFYVGVGALMPFQTDADATVLGVTDEVSYKNGWGMTGSVGYGWGFGLRTEAEVAYRNSKVNNIKGLGVVTPAGGNLHNLALMGNALYDIDLGSRIVPYVGAGIGVSFVDADNLRTVNGATLDESRAAFAYQGIAGAALKLEGNWAFTADYRYFATTDAKFKTNIGSRGELENASHNLMLGIRYTFAEPAKPAVAPVAPSVAAPAAVAPAVAPIPQTYMVFFDWDKSVLTPEAKRIIASAAADYKKGKDVRIVVTGHTDTSGPKNYNQKLSERRANAVMAEFEKLGVPAAALVAKGVGENDLMVPTADGVREAQNRRAEIVFK